MATAMPGYDWELDDWLRVRLGMFSKILYAMKDEGIQPCNSGLMYMNNFYNYHFPPDPDDPEARPKVDIEPLADHMLHDTLALAQASKARATKIADYLENMDVIFAGKVWRAKVDGDIAAHGAEIQQIAADMKKAMAIHDPENLPYGDILVYREFLDSLEFVQARYEDLVAGRATGREYLKKNKDLVSVFNLAGWQTALAMETLRYAHTTTVVMDDTMQILLGIQVMSDARRSTLSARGQAMKELAEHLMVTAIAALDEGQRLMRDSYTAREFNKPVFRPAPPEISRQYPGSHPQ
ncbi:MAG: hypothetical protein JWO78_1355 [Micavibrio sp.]|nr:hypothetical protein [Micavibrio sp.]